MSCFKPIVAYKPPDGGSLVFHERKDHREIQIRCGQCIGCRIDKREAWAVRCYAESKLHANNMFITLTYDEANLPSLGGLQYRDFQLFAKRMRARCGPFRFFMCGEYGEEGLRPHYHALVFGYRFADAVKSNSIYSAFDLYESATLSDLWGKGICSFGEITYSSARYCAVYATKKVTGDAASDHYFRVDSRTGECGNVAPEFARMSLKPGIGLEWLRKYWKDVYIRGHNSVIVDGVQKRIPEYFDKKLMEMFPDVVDAHKFSQYKEAVNRAQDNTRDRLLVREKCAQARVNRYEEMRK